MKYWNGIEWQDLLNKKLDKTGDIIESYVEKITNLSGTTVEIDLSKSNTFLHTLTGTTTYTFSNVISSTAHAFALIVIQGGAAKIINWPLSVVWANGETPDTLNANKSYVLTFLTIDNGTTWLGMFGGEF